MKVGNKGCGFDPYLWFLYVAKGQCQCQGHG